jgi:hypothetical protein
MSMPDKCRHGGPWDRGDADYYYRRPFRPHMYEGNTGDTPEIHEDDMTPEQIADYYDGYFGRDHDLCEPRHK